jgi:hypothetical protein
MPGSPAQEQRIDRYLRLQDKKPGVTETLFSCNATRILGLADALARV